MLPLLLEYIQVVIQALFDEIIYHVPNPYEFPNYV